MLSSLEGQTLGNYRVLEPLGRGGMARVYRGYHPQLDRFVAIKVLRPDLFEDDLFMARFRREAQAVASLRHPNIVQVFDFDVQGDLSYMVMELLDGDTLHTRLNDYRVRDSRMPYGEMLRVLLDVLDGLAYAHDNGMVHRDIKPANILLTKLGQVVLADFGVAQIVGGTRHTVSGALLGTLNYMAPEQGLKGISDARSDLYSLGVVFFEMLTRRPPYDADTPLAILMKHVNDPLPLPSQIVADVPLALERVVLQALEKQPEHRYQSATEMATAVREAAAFEQIDIPQRVSLPMSFNTPEAPAESVSVYSGPDRARLREGAFAAGDTLSGEMSTHTAGLQVLKSAEKASIAPERATGDPPVVPVEPAVKQPHTVVRTLFNGFVLIVSVNLVMVVLMELFNAELFAASWTVELFLLAALFAWFMRDRQNIWLLLPAGFFAITAVFLTFTNVGNSWDSWSFLWALQMLGMVGLLVLTVRTEQRPDRRHLAYRYGRRLARFCLICTGIVVLAGLFA